MKIVTVQEMISIEKSANDAGFSYEIMMRNAGCGVASWVYQQGRYFGPVIGLVGSGNNGGDTIIALTELSKRGMRTFAFLVKQRESDPLVDEYINAGGVVSIISQNHDLAALGTALIPGSTLLDGILGTGVKLPIKGVLHDLMGKICDLVQNRPNVLKIAIDCPSGMDCDTGAVSDVTIRADITLSMAAVKQGLLLQPGNSFPGKLYVIDIGMGDLGLHHDFHLPEMITQKFVASHLPKRPSDGHKGTFGTCMVIAGTQPYKGAAYLTGKAAYRSGCGLVNVATLSEVYAGLSGNLIEAIWTVMPGNNGSYDPKDITLLNSFFQKADSLVVGPGMGLSAATTYFLAELLKAIPGDLPTLFDADGLKLLNQVESWWKKIPCKTILTPHPGEMSVLTGIDVKDIQENRWEITEEYAYKWGVVLVLKGAGTVIATPQGELHINPIINTALASAGSGDVLSGIIGGLLAQGMKMNVAAVVGVWLHSQAGVCAYANYRTDFSVTAIDILDCLHKAFAIATEAAF